MIQRCKALVTGGTRGIGKAICDVFQEAGWDVTFTGTAPGHTAPAGMTYLACDFADPRAVSELAERTASMEFSALVNNAGINTVAPLEQYEPADFARIQQVNMTAPFMFCRAVVPGMCKRRYGRIVNVTSIYGVVSKAGRSAYSASKFGLFGLTRALAIECARDNVLVNGLAPGIVDTDLTRQVLGKKGMAEIVTRIPQGRLSTPEEIAKVAAFLASDDNTYMTGQNIVVDGGYTCA